jgi:high-affinity iron transporter
MTTLFALLVAASLPARAADAAKGDPVRGAALYTANCTACHGTTGDGKGPAAIALTPRPTDFTASGWAASRTDADLASAIRAGRPGTSMTPFTRLSDAEVADLVAYLRAVPAKP